MVWKGDGWTGAQGTDAASKDVSDMVYMAGAHSTHLLCHWCWQCRLQLQWQDWEEFRSVVIQSYCWLSHPQHLPLCPCLSAKCSRSHPKAIFEVCMSRASIGMFCGVYASFSSMLMWFCCPGCLVILVLNLWGEFTSSTSIDISWHFCSQFQSFLGSLQYSTCQYV